MGSSVITARAAASFEPVGRSVASARSFVRDTLQGWGFSDIVDDLDFGAMVVNEVRYGRAGLFTDFIYVKISGSQGTPRGLLADSVSLSTESLIFTAAGEYRIIDRPDATLDLMAGARVWSVDTELGFNGGLPVTVRPLESDLGPTCRMRPVSRSVTRAAPSGRKAIPHGTARPLASTVIATSC